MELVNNKKVILSFEYIVDITIDYFEPYLGSVLQTIDFEKVIFFEIINKLSQRIKYKNSLFFIINSFFIPTDIKKEFLLSVDKEISNIIAKIKKEIPDFYYSFKIYSFPGYNILVTIYPNQEMLCNPLKQVNYNQEILFL